MAEYGAIDSDFVVFEADIGTQTFSWLFEEKFPERYFMMGIAESNMMAAAAGMAQEGRTVVACSYGVFVTMRALEAIRSYICYPNLNVKFLSSHAGITADIDGVSHQATEDIAFMSTLPNMKVFVPADTVAAKKLFDVAMQSPGPVFTRLAKYPLFDIYTESEAFKVGGSKVAVEGGDATIATYGDMVFQALDAAEELAKVGISAEVLDMYSVKPIDGEGLLTSIKKTGALLVVENHQRRNGLGYELSNFCLKNYPVPFENLGLNDTYAESGAYDLLLEAYGLSQNHIASAVKELINKKA